MGERGKLLETERKGVSDGKIQRKVKKIRPKGREGLQDTFSN